MRTPTPARPDRAPGRSRPAGWSPLAPSPRSSSPAAGTRPRATTRRVGVGGVVTDVEMEELNRRRKELPERVPLSTVGERHTLLLQQKAIIDRIKITAYNAEEMLRSYWPFITP